jgi:hypothetical protein
MSTKGLNFKEERSHHNLTDVSAADTVLDEHCTNAFDPERDFPRYEASNPRNHEWQELMASMQEPVPGAQPGEWWAEMKLVFML